MIFTRKGLLGNKRIEEIYILSLLIDQTLLTMNEIDWVNRYHKRVRNILIPSMNSNEKYWLMNQTAPL